MGMGCAALIASAGPTVRAAEPLSPADVRDSAAPRVCLVTVDGPLGLPVAYASGFLLGTGKFVVTDLASVAQPGVGRVTLRFQDGSTAVSRQFGMADPAIGLVAVCLEKPKTDVGGLSLSMAVAADEDGTPAVVVGWKWGQQLAIGVGRLTNGIPGPDLAEELKIDTPKSPPDFLWFLSPRLDIAAGAPVIDGGGGVVGILVRMIGSPKALVVPAGLLRSALLSAGTQLKPFAQLPKPIWPVAIQTLAGQPTTPHAFAGVVRAVKSRSRCATCNGTGKVVVRKLVGTNRIGGMVRPVYRNETQTCKACRGEGVVCGKGLYEYFARMAEGATRLLASPDTPEKARQAAIANGKGLLDALGRVGPRYRDALVAQARANLAKGDGRYPRGVVVYAQLREAVDGPDGKYAVLAPFRSSRLLAVKSERLKRPLGEEDRTKKATKPAQGDWIIVAGLAEGVVSLKGRRPIYLRPFGWAWGPSLSPKPTTAPPGTRPTTPTRQPPTRRDDGKPDFFGL